MVTSDATTAAAELRRRRTIGFSKCIRHPIQTTIRRSQITHACATSLANRVQCVCQQRQQRGMLFYFDKLEWNSDYASDVCGFAITRLFVMLSGSVKPTNIVIAATMAPAILAGARVRFRLATEGTHRRSSRVLPCWDFPPGFHIVAERFAGTGNWHPRGSSARVEAPVFERLCNIGVEHSQ